MGFMDFIKAANQSKKFVLKNILNSSTKAGNECFDRPIHVSVPQKYPAAAILPLPINIDPSETTRFSPQRTRDISATAIVSHEFNLSKSNNQSMIDITLDSSSLSSSPDDPHVDSYDCSGAVSLNSSMQSNVPSPFGGLHKFSHLNMPGGQWSQDSKFMSDNLHTSHYINLRNEYRALWSNNDSNATTEKGIINYGNSRLQCMTLKNNLNNRLMHNRSSSLLNLHDNTNNFSLLRMLSSSSSSSSNLNRNQNKDIESKQTATTATILNSSLPDDNKLTQKDKLKRAFKEYGTTVIVFHVGISLVSLGMFYLLVSSGVDLIPLIEKIGLGSTALSSKVATGAGTFVIAYAIHKVFAPVRISITLGSTPFIVKYLRRKGILKPPQKSSSTATTTTKTT